MTSVVSKPNENFYHQSKSKGEATMTGEHLFNYNQRFLRAKVLRQHMISSDSYYAISYSSSS